MLTAIFALTPLSGNTAIESAVATALISQGERVVFVTCDGSRPRCILDNFSQPDFDRAQLCRTCHEATRAFTSQLALREAAHVDLGPLIDARLYDEAVAGIASLPDEGLYDYVYDGMPLGTWAIDGLRLAYFGENWRNLDNLAAITRRTLESMVATSLATEAFIARYAPQTILALNGLVPDEHVVWELGRRHGIHTVLYEGGQRPGTIHLNDSQPACFYDVGTAWEHWQSIPLTRAESDTLDQFMISRMYQAAGGYVYSPSSQGDAGLVRKLLQLPPDAPLLVAYTNCAADTSVFAANTVFARQIDWIDTCIRYAADHPEVALVIRVHPVEADSFTYRDGKVIAVRDKIVDGVAERWPELPANVRIVGGKDLISSYDLMRAAQVVLAYVSTVGIEAALLGKPVITAGSYHYTDKAFTYAPTTPQAYVALLDDLIARPRPVPYGMELARRYMHLWMFRGMLFMPNLDVDPKTQATSLRPRPVAECARGRSPHYDHLVDYLRGQRPAIGEPEPWRQKDIGAPVPLRFAPAWTLMAVPDWERLDDFAQKLLHLTDGARQPLSVQIVSGPFSPDEAARRLVESLAARAAPESWPDLDVIPGDLPEAALGRLMMESMALLSAKRTSFGDRLPAMAHHAGVPIIALDDPTAVRTLANRLQAPVAAGARAT